ncbi:GtrA family protein [Agrobacterium sp. ES01]|uniref:GtrA family protein n=1 Tax=Agrobacterium sp. ES01 TaxID=3420714 RepID=UPI003D099DDD
MSVRLLLSWLRGKVFFKYALTGILNTLIDLAIFSVLLAFGASAQLANIIGFLSGATNSYVLNRNFTFAVGGGLTRRSELSRVLAFLIVTLIGTAISFLTFFILDPLIGHFGAKLLSILTVLWVGFALNRFFVFRTAD